MDLDHPEAGLTGADGRSGEVGDDGADFVSAQGLRRRVVAEGDSGRRHRGPASVFDADRAAPRIPGPVGAGLAAGVGQLDTGHAALPGDKVDNARQGRNLPGIPQAEILRADASAR